MIKLIARSFSTHKKAESPDDCQDAVELDDEWGRYAVADGATRSFFPKEWATLLVEHFCESPDLPLTETDWQDWIAPIQQKWYKQVEERVEERNLFFLRNSFIQKEPALATFIGLKFNKDNGEWRSMIVGDSCLFHIGDSGFQSYLIGKSSDFTNRPEAVASFPKDNHHRPTVINGHAKPGDSLILATDALAKWILEYEEAGKLNTALDALKALETDEQFHRFVAEARDNEGILLVNDDVTLMLISVEAIQKQEDTEPEASSEEQPRKPTQQLDDILLILFWAIFAGLLAFFVVFIIIVWTLLNMK